jgi:hypothetical protein
MNISARLAVQSAGGYSANVSPSNDYHGRNVVVRTLDESGFEADCAHEYPVGALVRIRLPGAGYAMARVTEADDSRVCAAFVNPVGRVRLNQVLGARR